MPTPTRWGAASKIARGATPCGNGVLREPPPGAGSRPGGDEGLQAALETNPVLCARSPPAPSPPRGSEWPLVPKGYLSLRGLSDHEDPLICPIRRSPTSRPNVRTSSPPTRTRDQARRGRTNHHSRPNRRCSAEGTALAGANGTATIAMRAWTAWRASHRRNRIVAHFGATSAVEGFHVKIASHLESERHLVE